MFLRDGEMRPDYRPQKDKLDDGDTIAETAHRVKIDALDGARYTSDMGRPMRGKTYGEAGGGMTERVNISSGAKWEDVVGYSRAVRVGNVVEVAGTAAIGDDGQVVGRGDAYAQAAFILAKIERALHAAGAELTDVVRTRIYVTDITRWEEIGRAHGERFRHIKPASTMVEVAALVDPAVLVEIEATAVVGAGS